jgi:hypothetical protein
LISAVVPHVSAVRSIDPDSDMSLRIFNLAEEGVDLLFPIHAAKIVDPITEHERVVLIPDAVIIASSDLSIHRTRYRTPRNTYS